MVGGVIADPSLSLWTGSRPHFRTGRATLRQAQGMLSPHPAPEHTSCCHQRHDNEPYQLSWLDTCTGWMAEVWLSTAVFSTSGTPAIRPFTSRCLCLPCIPAPLPAQSEAKGQPILGITPGFRFLGHPFTAFMAGSTPLQHPAWPPSCAKSCNRFPRSGCPLFRDFRMVLRFACLRQRRCPFEWLPCTNVLHGLNTVPCFDKLNTSLGLPINRFGKFCMTACPERSEGTLLSHLQRSRVSAKVSCTVLK